MRNLIFLFFFCLSFTSVIGQDSDNNNYSNSTQFDICDDSTSQNQHEDCELDTENNDENSKKLNWMIALLFGGGSLVGLTADIVGIFGFVLTIKRKQYQDIPTKLTTILLIFLFSVLLYCIARNPEIIKTLDNVIYFFAIIYMLLSVFTVFFSISILKGTNHEVKHYLGFGMTVLVIYALSLFLLNLTGKNIHYMSFLFFFCGLIQSIYIIGENIMKRYLITRNFTGRLSIFGEYPIAFRFFLEDLIGLRKIFLIRDNLKYEFSDNDIEVEYKFQNNYLYDVAFLIYISILGAFLLSFNTNYAFF